MTRITGGPRFFGRPQKKTRASGRDDSAVPGSEGQPAAGYASHGAELGGGVTSPWSTLAHLKWLAPEGVAIQLDQSNFALIHPSSGWA